MARRARGELDPSLVARAVAGEADAQKQVFDHEREMIRRQARARSEKGLTFEDLVQEGSLGLLSAMHEFVGGVAAPFGEYAETRVGEQMDAALREEEAAAREDRQLAEDAGAFEQAEIALRRELGRTATPEEIRARLGWPAERLDEVAAAVADARQRHDEQLLPFLESDYLDPIEWLGADEPEQSGGEDSHGGRREP